MQVNKNIAQNFENIPQRNTVLSVKIVNCPELVACAVSNSYIAFLCFLQTFVASLCAFVSLLRCSGASVCGAGKRGAR